ncbi:dihydroorotate dehydrogenase electron transfer subunit [candidate division KSB1 bacterium]|nr:MAG: dihydroorotate dehydrogenase electron transfer subunit [candidate division KSB1 bacterium]
MNRENLKPIKRNTKVQDSRIYLDNYTVLEKEWLNPTFYRLRLDASTIAAVARPGQFVNVRVTPTCDPLLRRPLSIFRVHRQSGWIELLVKLVGRGSRLLSEVQPQEQLNLLGPLGHGFDLETCNTALVVGGGIGIAPLVFLIEELIALQRSVMVFLGFRHQKEVCCIGILKNLPLHLEVATDDGSVGFSGLVTSVLENYLQTNSLSDSTCIFACGPTPMLKKIDSLARRFSLPWQFSLETFMACGIGACMGCAIPAANGADYKLVCKDGPVFSNGQVKIDG